MISVHKTTEKNIIPQKGLSTSEAQKLLIENGPNEIVHNKKASPLALFFGQFNDFITLILIAATIVSYLLKEYADSVTILIIVLMNGLLGFIQEFKTEKSLEALKKLSAPFATVIRDGTESAIPAREIVTGDMLVLEAGDIVPADAVLVESFSIQTNESILTGESVSVDKVSSKFSGNDKKAYNNESLIFMGTQLTTGRGKAVVIGTGMKTEMGQIAQMLDKVEEEDTPLQRRLNKIGKDLVMISLGVCAIVAVAGILHGETIFNMILSGVSLAVAAIPEGLPATVTVALAIGVQRMLKHNALVRRLPAVETLGCTNIICSDKTGTLTENKMTVKKLFLNDRIIDITGGGYETKGQFMFKGTSITPNDNPNLKTLLTAGALCNNAEFRDGEPFGDPTEIAILVCSKKGDIDIKNLSEYSRIDEIPFDSDRKRMSVICRGKNNELVLFVKGAPDQIVNLCTNKLTSSGKVSLSDLDKKSILNTNNSMANDALRVLGFAFKKLDHLPNKIDASLERGLTFIGLEGMIDPPRPEAIEAIKKCYKAKIRPVMITGDHKITALAVARELGMSAEDSAVLTGDDIEKLSDEQLQKVVSNTTVFARVSPKHKLRIVRAFKKKDNIVAMTGDGVNDAPALKESDIGIAMGKSGTDVAKESSSMILLDDNFATIVAAVEEGRVIYDNIRKFIRYLLSCNLGEIVMMAIAALLGAPLPLLPIQILWVNLVTDGLPALALGVDKPDKDIMSKPPRKHNENIFSKGLGSKIIFSGILIGASALTAFTAIMYMTGDMLKGRTAAFLTMIIAELIFAFESKSETKHIFKINILENPYLILAVLGSLALTLMVLYNPVLSAIFKTTPLTSTEWLVVLGFSLVEMVSSTLNNVFLVRNEGRK